MYIANVLESLFLEKLMLQENLMLKNHEKYCLQPEILIHGVAKPFLQLRKLLPVMKTTFSG